VCFAAAIFNTYLPECMWCSKLVPMITDSSCSRQQAFFSLCCWRGGGEWHVQIARTALCYCLIIHLPNVAAGDIEDHCISCCDCLCWTYKVSQSWHSLVLEGVPRWNQLVMNCLISWQ
jgi:hypothetical protein